MEKTFYKVCPTRGCRIISGFCLTLDEIKKDEEYICQNCQKESKLSKWKNSTEREYFKWVKRNTSEKELKKLKKCRMVLPAEQKASKKQKERQRKIDKWKAKWK